MIFKYDTCQLVGHCQHVWLSQYTDTHPVICAMYRQYILMATASNKLEGDSFNSAQRPPPQIEHSTVRGLCTFQVLFIDIGG